jgi:hypothetical protein
MRLELADRESVAAVARPPCIELDQTIGVTIGQGTQQHGVHHAEDGGVGADAHGQHRHGHEGK